MKTLKGLNAALEANNLDLQIGVLRLKGGRDKDIDIYIRDRQVAWIHSDQDVDTKLEYLQSNVFSKVFADEALVQERDDLKSEVESLATALSDKEDTIKGLNRQLNDALDAPVYKGGMIEAYEKVLGVYEAKDNDNA